MSKALEQGSNNITTLQNDRVLKIRRQDLQIMHERQLMQQMQMWNKYYAGTGLDTAVITEQGELSTPYIEGEYPSDEQWALIIEDMLARGYVMQDCRDKRNFIVSNGVTYPVDFGQVYTPETTRFYNIYMTQARTVQRGILARLDCQSVADLRGRKAENNNTQDNVEFLQLLCEKAQTKVHNRGFFGIAGQRVQVGDKSYVVPGHLAQAIKANINKVSSLEPEAFKTRILRDLKKIARTKVKRTTSRDVWTQKLYNGKYASGSNPAAFFNTMIADDQPKQAAVPGVSGPNQRLTS
ncbi:MAG: hypothetical protein P1U40_08130 [Coxiellaceae bacterium]|nr:hypothetical protein [Coxiellaceae bacterium]